MSIATELRTQIKNNQRTIFITEADDLLAAWKFKRQSTTRRSKNMNSVPTKLRCTPPHCKTNQLMPCHTSIRRKAGQTFTKVVPPPEYSTQYCHGHGRISKISMADMNDLERITFTKNNISPFVSPVLDTGTLALVAKDLGFTGKAIPKMIHGRQYIAFTDTTGSRTIFPRTFYAANNTKIIKMAIGSMGIGKMVAKGALITFVLTVPLSVMECYLNDQTAWYQLAGNIGVDFIKIGVPALIGLLMGLAVNKFILYILYLKNIQEMTKKQASLILLFGDLFCLWLLWFGYSEMQTTLSEIASQKDIIRFSSRATGGEAVSRYCEPPATQDMAPSGPFN